MNKETWALHYLLTRMDDKLFQTYAGLVNAQSLSRMVSTAEELDILRCLLQEEYRSTHNPEIIRMQEMLESFTQPVW